MGFGRWHDRKIKRTFPKHASDPSVLPSEPFSRIASVWNVTTLSEGSVLLSVLKVMFSRTLKDCI